MPKYDHRPTKRRRSKAQKDQVSSLPKRLHGLQRNQDYHETGYNQAEFSASRPLENEAENAHIIRDLRNTARRERRAKSRVALLDAQLRTLTVTTQQEHNELQTKLHYALNNLEAVSDTLKIAGTSNKLLERQLGTGESVLICMQRDMSILEQKNIAAGLLVSEQSTMLKKHWTTIQRLQNRNHTLGRNQDALRKRIARAPTQKACTSTKTAEYIVNALQKQNLKDSKGIIKQLPSTSLQQFRYPMVQP